MLFVRFFSLCLCVLTHGALFASASNDPEADLMESFVAHVQAAPALDLFALEKAHHIRSETQSFFLTDKAPTWDALPSMEDVKAYLSQVPYIASWLKINLACVSDEQTQNQALGKALFALMVNARAWPVTFETLVPTKESLVPQVLSLASESGSASLVQTLPLVMHPDDLTLSKAGALETADGSHGRTRISLTHLTSLFPMQRTLYLHHATYAYPYLDWREHYGLYQFYATRTREDLMDLHARNFALEWGEVAKAFNVPLGSALREKLCANDAAFKTDSWPGDGEFTLPSTPSWHTLSALKKLAPGVYNDTYYAQSFLPLMEGKPLVEWATPPMRDTSYTNSKAALVKPAIIQVTKYESRKKKGKCLLQ